MTNKDLETLYNTIKTFFNANKDAVRFLEGISGWNARRGFRRRLSPAAVVTLNLIRFQMKIGDLKNFHRHASDSLRWLFPELPNYENFLKATNKSLPFAAFLINHFLNENRSRGGRLHFIDSTPVPVCLNHHIRSHKVAKGLARRGRSTRGWFYGFKLHGVCDAHGNLEAILFTPGNVSDGTVAERLTEGLLGDVFADAGYLQKAEALARMSREGRCFRAAPRKNMGRLLSKPEFDALRRRNIIEVVWGRLKSHFQLVYHMARSITGMFRHFLYCLASFFLHSGNSLVPVKSAAKKTSSFS